MNKSQDNVNSVNRVFSIIEALARYPNGCSLSILVKETELNKSTIHRFLKTLIALGYVSNSVIENNYRLSFKIANIGQKLIHETNVVQLSLLELTNLRNKTGGTVNLKLFQNDHSVLLFKLEPTSGNFRTRTYMGQSIPLYCSATGKVFLSGKSETFVRSFWKKKKNEIKKLTPSTIVDIEEFLQSVEKVRKQGYAIDHEENELGISCIAAPIYDINGEINYAVSIAMQSIVLQEKKIENYIQPLLETTRNLSREMGYQEN